MYEYVTTPLTSTAATEIIDIIYDMNLKTKTYSVDYVN